MLQVAPPNSRLGFGQGESRLPFAHTPYDGSKQPFSIGLEPLDPAGWIEPDGNLADDLARKERLLTDKREAVVRYEPDTPAAQAEVLSRLAAHLPARFPDIYRREGDGMHIVPAGRAVALEGKEAPLVTAARLVQEDLCLMRRGTGGWRLAAGVLCFPSGWSLADKIGRGLGAIHAPVPGFAGKMDALVTRIFDNLRDGAPLVRFNWSIYGNGDLRQAPGGTPARMGNNAAGAHIRVERQTLTLLPVSGDILFTIRIHTDAISRLEGHARGPELASGLRAQLLGLDAAQAEYKGLAGAREELALALKRIAGGD